ncbi:MAG TPA: hypothetical protein PK542_01090 [Treponemataceae bacterium]|nr:hypothetical protein [Treponemataceae bacterium]HPS43060.1 hypothetical protein [Treponemataceae bacterium]
MRNFLISLGIGIAAAAIDVGPMIARRMDPAFVASAAVTWIALGIVIPAARLMPISWLNGLCVALLFVAPIVCLVTKLDPRAIPIMLGMSAALGAGVGFASGLLAK